MNLPLWVEKQTTSVEWSKMIVKEKNVVEMARLSWKHWIPSYVRNEIKKKTGVNVDGYGNKIQDDSKAENPDSMFQRSKQVSSVGNKEFNDISSYKPSGNMIYNKDLLKNIENKSKK